MATPHALKLNESPAKALFMGQLIQENLFPYPQADAAESELLSMVLDTIDKLMREHADDFAQWDRDSKQPDSYINTLKDLGLFGLIIPEKFGGIGFSASAYSRVIQQTSRYDSSTSLTIGAHSSIGMKGLLLFGTQAQQEKYLPKLATGEMIAAFCLTEPSSGSDAASIKTTAKKADNGDWIISGEKLWITNGGIANFFTVFARTEAGHGKLSAFIVERSFEGVSHGAKEDKLGIRASSTCSVLFNEVRVPEENLLGTEGKGFKIAMSILNSGRTGLGGGSVGGMKRCIELATQQSKQRHQFGRSISEFGLIKQKIAQMTIDCFASESTVGMIGHYIDSGCKDYSVEAAIAKVFSSEAMLRTADESLQIAGGNGYMKEFPYEQIWRDSRILPIFEGTNEILRLYIALSGMKDVGDNLKDVLKGANDIFNNPIKGFGVLSDYATRKFSQFTNLGGDRIVSEVGDALQNEALVYEKYTLELARTTDILLRRHGKNIIGKQFSMKRVADVVIDIFVGLCVLSRCNSMQTDAQCNAQRRQQSLTIAQAFTQQAKRRMNQNLRRVLRNEDESIKALADSIIDNENYPWDLF